MASMKIGAIAKRSGIGIETIRFYEREGLLQKPLRQPSGYRQFDESTLERLEYIRSAKELGFTLSEIRTLLELSFSAHASCEHIQQKAEDKLADVEEKIRSLQKMRRSIKGLLKRCRAKNAAVDCPLVHKTSR
jgi:Hg(II)-responsive transcriptional regulator